MSKTIHKLTHPTGTMQWLSNPGGAIVTKAMNNGKTYQGPIGAIAQPYGPAPENPNSDPNDPNSPNYNPINQYKPAPNGQSSYPAHRLGWTNGGYKYANSPWNGQPITPANTNSPGVPMSFSPPPQLQNPSGGGTVPGAGAQPPVQGPPPTRFMSPEQQQALIRGLRAQ